jgi:hypothetical protein
MENHAMNQSIAELAALAAQTSDQSVDTAPVYEDTLPPAGKTGMRFIEYIEFGHQPQRAFEGKPKQPAPEFRMTFELLGKNYVHEVEVEGGEKKIIADRIGQIIKISLSDKATFRKLFTAMSYGRPDIKHMAQMLGEPFLGTVTHSPETDKDGKKIKQYANLRTEEGAIGIGAPFLSLPVLDDEGQPTGEVTKTALKVREALSPLKIFLFDHPSKETWDTLFIDGTREVTDDKGQKSQQSKNWMQERILASTKFSGSALEAMLNGISGLSIEPEGETAPPAAAKAPPAAAKAAAGQPKPAPKASARDDAAAALAALGLEAEVA